MLKLLLGKDWTVNRDEFLTRIAEDVRNQRSGVILLVPELISHDMERRMCAAAGDTCCRFAEVLSFTRLCRRVSDYVGAAPEPCLDQGGRVAAMAAAARQLHSKLKAYAAVETKPEFLKGLVDAVDEFKRCCISSEDLRIALAKSEGGFAQKLEELALLLDSYDSLCALGKRDPRDQESLMLQQLEESNFAENHTFYIDGFPDLTRQHLDIIAHLIAHSPSVTVSLTCDQLHSSALAFEKASNTAGDILKCAQRADIEVEIQYIQSASDSLQEVRDKLFQGHIEELRNSDQSVLVLRSESAYTEVNAVAERISRLIQNGARYRDIAVVCPDLATYQPLLRQVFQRCHIPAYLSGTDDILQKSVVVTVLSAMNAALGGFDTKDVLRYLKSALSPLDQELCDSIENYAIVWGIRGNLWLECWTKHPNGLSAEWTDGAKAKLAVLNECRSLAMDPLEHLRNGFRGARNLKEMVVALYHFLEEVNFAKRLTELADELERSGDPREAQILNQLWEILLTALEQIYDILGDTVWDGDSFVRLFTLLLSQYDVGTIPPVLDSVTVGNPSAMRCQQVKHLFVIGALEGNLPGYGGSTGVLTDQERVALRQMGIPLTGGAMDGLQSEFSDIYGVFCGARVSVCISCPSGQSSFVFRRIAEMTGGEEHSGGNLGAALQDPNEAGAYLARWNKAEEAALLGVGDCYFDVKRRCNYDLGTVDRTHIDALYGSRLELSASQVDRQAECRLSYFLRYGLRAKECKEATVDPAEFGTYVHAVLEETAREIKDLGGFHQVSLEKTKEIARKHSDHYISQQFDQIDSQRVNCLFRRNYQELEMVLQELWLELKESLFEPRDFEVSFGEDGQMEPISVPGKTMDAILRGFVDRVDTWCENGNHYFRVVDYKTGRKDFDYCDVFNGVGLQMLLYLFALEENGEKIVGQRPIPSGVQYFPARAPLISADGKLSDEEAEETRVKEWKRKGLLLNNEDTIHAMEPTENPVRLCCIRKKDGSLSGDLADRQQLRMLRDYVFQILGRMVDEIASGNVEPNPYTRGSNHDACAFCPYGAVCHYANVKGRRNYKTMTAQRFWEEIGKELDHG